MTSLGELTLDLKLNDKAYNKGIAEARKKAEAMDREFVSVLRADTKNFLAAFEQAERVKNRLDRVITAEFRVNTNQIRGALEIAENARREFKKTQNTTFTADNSQFLAAVKEIRAARRNIDKPIKVKIGVEIQGLFNAVNNATKAIARLRKPVAVTFTANDRALQLTLNSIDKATTRLRKPVSANFRAKADQFFKVFRNVEAAKKRASTDVVVNFKPRNEGSLLSVLERAEAARKRLAGTSTVVLQADARKFFRAIKLAESAKKDFRSAATTTLNANAAKFFRAIKAANEARKTLSKTITVEIRANATQFFRAVKRAEKAKQDFRSAATTEFKLNANKFFKGIQQVERARKTVTKDVTVNIRANATQYFKAAKRIEQTKKDIRSTATTELRLNANKFFSGLKRAEQAKKSVVRDVTVRLRADAGQYFRTTKRIESEKKKFRGTATTELRANASQFFRATKAVKEQKKDLGKPVSTTLRLNKEQYRQDLRAARADTREFKREFGSSQFRLPRVNSREFERSISDAGSRGRNILAGIFQGIGQEIFQTITTALTAALSAPIRLGGGAIAAFSDVEAGLVNFEAKARSSVESAEELARVSAKVADEAERIGIETSKTPAQVAQIATRMIELGATANQAANNVDGVVTALEATGFTDIDKTAKSFQLAANVFGESSEEFADKLALLTSSTAVTTATDVEQAFGKAGGAFRAAGQDLESLLALFSGFRSASGPEVAATATRNAVAKLLPPAERATEIIDKLGITLFDSAGEALPILDVLEDLKGRIEDLPQEERLRFLQQVFDRRSASEIALILEQLDTVRSTYDGLREDSEGVAKQLQRDLNQGIGAAVNRLGGTIQTLAGAFGKALGPGVEALIRSLTVALNTVTEAAAGGLFDPLTESVERFFIAISGTSLSNLLGQLRDGEGPVDGLGRAFVRVADTIQGALASVIDGFTTFIQNNPDALSNFVDGFASGFNRVFEVVGQVISKLSEIGRPIAGIAQNLFAGLAGQSDLLIGALSVVVDILRPVAELLERVSDNAFLVDVAFKSIVAVNIFNSISALIPVLSGLGAAASTAAVGVISTSKALAAASVTGNFTAVATSIGGLTASLSALTATAVAVVAPIAILAAGIAAIQFIRQTKAAREFNDAIEALANATNTLGESGIQAAQRLKNAIAAANEERAKGLDIDQQALRQRIKLAEQEKKALAEQQRELERQLSEVPTGSGGVLGFGRGINDAQRGALENQIKETEAAEKALNSQIESANELLQVEQDRLRKTDELRQQDLESFQENEQAKQESAENRIAAVEAAVKAASARINQSEAEAINAVLEQQLNGLDEDTAAQRIREIEAKAAEERVAQKRKELDEIIQLEADGVLEAEKAAEKKAEIEAQRTQLVRQQLEAQIQAQKEAEDRRRDEAVRAFGEFNEAANRAFEEQSNALQKQLDTQIDAEKQAFEERQKLLKDEFEFREEQLKKQQEVEDKALKKRFDAQKKALADQQRLEKEANDQKLSAVERFVDRQLQLEQAADSEERNRLEEQFANEDAQAKRRSELEEKALRRSDQITGRERRRRGDPVSPIDQARQQFDDDQQAEVDRLAAQQEAVQEKVEARQAEAQERLAQQREEQELRLSQQRELLEQQQQQRREQLEAQVANDRRTLEDELSLRRQEAETGLQQDRAAFAANQRQLDINAANEVARILSAARPQALTARRHGGPVGPGSSFLVGEAPHIGPELGVFGGKPFLFAEPTVLPNPPQGKIYSPEQTKRILATPNQITRGGDNDAAIADEIRQLRQQVGRIREVMPLLEALSQNLATDSGQLQKDQLFEKARWQLRGL
ncbi:phage tail tape measure protein, TP901 family [Leptolyngbya sp. PCC 7375]|nr:phage tail tape measure protein, TP901 family [Leptolyngbya sp. PCC 7375]